jgi:50S ribosomal subunit-associated GTPase HflX
VRVLCADASSEELEDEVATAGRALAEGVGRKAGPDGGPDDACKILCLNKIDLVSEGRVRELERLYPEAVLISALSDAGPLLDAIYAAISSGRERMEVLIPHEDYGAASRLYGLAEIHAQENTTSGVWMDVSLPRSASGKYAPYRA